MKTKTFFFLCLLFGAASLKLFAQGDPPVGPIPEGTKTVSWYADYYIYDLVYYNGEVVDIVEGPIVWHNVSHYKNGVLDWWISTAKGEIISTMTGEHFSVSEQDVNKSDGEIIPFHNNLMGSNGSHYITSGYGYFSTFGTTWETFFTKVVLPGMKK